MYGGSSSIGGCRHSRWIILALVGVAVLVGSSSIDGCRRFHRDVSPFSMGHPCIDGCRHARWVIPAVCCSRWIILAEVNSCCFPLMGVAMFGVDLAEMTGANSGCLLCPVGHPCIGGCRRSGGHSPSRCVAVLVWSSSIEMCRHARCRSCRDDRSQQRLSAVLVGSSLHREVSPCMVGYPCRSQQLLSLH